MPPCSGRPRRDSTSRARKRRNGRAPVSSRMTSWRTRPAALGAIRCRPPERAAKGRLACRGGGPESLRLQPISLDRWLEVSRSHLDPSLVDDGALSRLRETSRPLPGGSVAAIEVRLGAAGPVDLSVRVAQPAQARHLASRVGPPHLRALLLEWARSAELRQAVPALWLEFDLDGRLAAAPLVPSICAQLAPDCSRRWLLDWLLPALHGRPLAAAERRTLRRCCDAIPAGVRLLYAFSLLSRQPGGGRLELMAAGSRPLLEYLSRLAPHAARPLAASGE